MAFIVDVFGPPEHTPTTLRSRPFREEFMGRPR